MGFTLESLREAMDFIGFPDWQRDAIEATYHAVKENPCFEEDREALKVSEGKGGVYPALILLSAFEKTREAYRVRGISEDILRDALSDIPLWISHCRRVFGEVGLREFDWLAGYMRLRIFRLGRLEFAMGESGSPAMLCRRADGTLEVCPKDAEPTGEVVLAPGMPVIEVHIPEGPKLSPEAVEASLAAAPGFFKAHFGRDGFRAFECESWLMSPCFAEIAPGSNLDRFQALFVKTGIAGDDSQMFERLYDCRDGRLYDMDALPLDTSLRRAMKAYYERGGRCEQVWGVLPIGGVI